MAVRFMVNLIYDDEYKGYVADVPELPGCMSQGKTVEAALRNIREAIALYREVSRPKRGHTAPRPALTTTVEV
jgi:predicted RNase H-like HicB family nuclease